MRLTIEKMQIENFKGIRSCEIVFSDTVTSIFGANGTGKSTIADAFSWVLFNKDSHGNAAGSDAFREKPLDNDGKEEHFLDTTVRLFCTLDGKPFNLFRTQRENWAKKRGHSENVYQGNVSTYWVNDVETKLSDFRDAIAKIASEDVFRLIASLSAFNQIEWKKRREQLLSLAGEDVDGILLARDEYRPIADEIAQRGIEVDDLKKVLTDQRKRTNDQLKLVPVRIDEAKKALPVFAPREVEDAEYIIKDSQKDIENVDACIAELRTGNAGNDGRMKLLALEQELVSLKRGVVDEHNRGLKELQSKADIARDKFRMATISLSEQQKKIDADKARLDSAIQKRDVLRQKYKDEWNRPLSDVQTVCPYCGQDMPSDAVQKAIEQQKKERKEVLDKIRADGKSASAIVEEYQAIFDTETEDGNRLKRKADEAILERDEAYEKVKAYPSEPDYSSEPRIAEIEKAIYEMRNGQSALPDENIRQFEERKKELQTVIDRKRAVLAKRDAGVETEKRIAELEKLQVEYGVQLAELENMISLVERFAMDRCGALEESINGKFPTLRWKLFDMQINGGIADCCVCMIPCESGLVSYESANTAAQVNADVEIVNVLSEHYELQLPLFVDNRERVNVLEKTDSQLITLTVSTDPELVVEKK